MTRRFLVAAAALLIGSATAPQLQAQALTGPNCTVGTNCGHTLSGTVPTLIRLVLENATTSLGTVTEAQFDNGQLVDGPRFEVRANRAYNVTIAAASGTWTGANAAKVAGDARYAVVTNAATCTAAGAFTALTTTAATIYSAAAGLPPAPAAVLQHRVELRHRRAGQLLAADQPQRHRAVSPPDARSARAGPTTGRGEGGGRACVTSPRAFRTHSRDAPPSRRYATGPDASF